MLQSKDIVLGISVLGKIFIVLAVFLALEAREKLDDYKSITIPEVDLDTDSALLDQENVGIEQKVILAKSRDLLNSFKAPVEKSNKPKKKSDLKLRLVGTTVTATLKPIAIIENTATKKQDAFELGETVFDNGTLAEVSIDKIGIERDGQIETIEVAEGDSGPSDPNSSNIRSDGGNFIVPEDEVNAALSNLPVLLTQARAVPYFRNGQSIGMRLYAIKAGSLYEKLGLKNSDIIKEINNSPVTDPSKALKLFEDLKSQRSIAVGVEREGQDTKLNYQVR
jgi:general secretion pathway protein C